MGKKSVIDKLIAKSKKKAEEKKSDDDEEEELDLSGELPEDLDNFSDLQRALMDCLMPSEKGTASSKKK